jgi:hypothetical protein
MMDNNIKRIDIDLAILNGNGMEIFKDFDTLTSEELVIIRNKCKSAIKKALGDKSLSAEDVDSVSLSQNKQINLIKAMVNTRFSDNGISTSRISNIIMEAINAF